MDMNEYSVRAIQEQGEARCQIAKPGTGRMGSNLSQYDILLGNK
jgi:hypothetical protein